MLRHTRLQPVPGLDGIRLHLSDDVMALWRAVHEVTGNADEPIPFWAFAWGGGLAIALYLREHPDAVAGKRVLDLGSGSGLCAIVAMSAGATQATAVDIDPVAIEAIGLNARANSRRITALQADLLDGPPPDADVVLAGDCWYEPQMGARATSWLQRCAQAGLSVLIGDPGRRYLADDAVRELATYEVRSTTDLEDLGRTRAYVYELRSPT